MRWLLWLTVGLVVVVAALPFIVLSAMGVMRPTEGFCVEGLMPSVLRDYGGPPTAQEQEQSFFVSPELADPTIRVPLGAIFGDASDGIDWRWPLCMRTRRVEHRFAAGHAERALMKLGEPNLHHAVQTGSVYRMVTSPSFSRVPIAFRLEVRGTSGAGTLTSAWLEDDGTKPDYTTSARYDAWQNAPLPRRTMQRTLTAEQTRALQAVLSDLPPYQMFNLDGVGLAIESVHDGRRDARSAFLFPPPDATGRLFCAVANQSGIPKKVLADGDVNHCGD